MLETLETTYAFKKKENTKNPKINEDKTFQILLLTFIVRPPVAQVVKVLLIPENIFSFAFGEFNSVNFVVLFTQRSVGLYILKAI